MNATLPTSAEASTRNEFPLSPTELVQAMSPEDKEAVFLALLREALQRNGENGLMPIEDEDGRPLGYYVPPRAAQFLTDQQWAEMPPEVRERMNRRVDDLDNSITAEQFLARLHQPADSPSP